jgi:hypothetical protein
MRKEKGSTEKERRNKKKEKEQERRGWTDDRWMKHIN